jgi:RimJ/RimL family protein N-acetyltransferase
VSEEAPQPVGEPVDFSGATPPDGRELRGDRVTLRAFEPARDAEPMYRVSHAPDGDPRVWTYLYEGPFPDLPSYEAQLTELASGSDPTFYAIVPKSSGVASGQASYMAIVPEHGTIEIGSIWLAPTLQRTAEATEAIYVLAAHAFDDLGYRRLEWKCNALNAPSRAAAQRFGFAFEGIFAQHRVVKAHNRDTAWYSITDQRWPQIKAGFQAWLAPENFDQRGIQRRSLRELTGDGGHPVRQR